MAELISYYISAVEYVSPTGASTNCVGKNRLSIPSKDVSLMDISCITFMYVIDKYVATPT